MPRSKRCSALVSFSMLAALAVAGACRRSPAPAPRFSVGFGVDTSVADVGAVVRLVRDYLAHPDSTARTRALWSTADSLDRRAGDLMARFGLYTTPATVLGVLAVPPGDSVYAVRIHYTNTEATPGRSVPLALQRLYAVRAPGTPHGWRLSNALPRLTSDWERRAVGRIEYYYAPGQRPDPARSAQAARFADSVAALFDVPPRTRIHYYVTASPEAYYRAFGLDFYPLPSGPGGGRGGQGGLIPGTDEGLVLAGDPSQGEAYLHELTHTVLGGRLGGGGFIQEGVATWLGGSKGRPPSALYGDLAAFQRANPAVTLAALVRGETGGEGEVAKVDAAYASGALVVDALYRRAGVAGLRALRTAPRSPPELLRFIEQRLGLPAGDAAALERWWRAEAAAAAGGTAGRALTSR